MMLWYAYRQDPSMTALLEAQQRAEKSQMHRYLTISLKLRTAVVELEKGWEKMKEVQHYGTLV